MLIPMFKSLLNLDLTGVLTPISLEIWRKDFLPSFIKTASIAISLSVRSMDITKNSMILLKFTIVNEKAKVCYH